MINDNENENYFIHPGQRDIVNKLLLKHADYDHVNKYKRSAIFYAILNGKKKKSRYRKRKQRKKL